MRSTIALSVAGVPLVFLLGTTDALAFGTFRSAVPNGFVFSCQTCHVNASGGQPWNDFGNQIMNQGTPPNWATLYNLDADGDGQTNGQELGDPCGTWTSGTAPRTTAISRPGDSMSTSMNPNTPVCPPPDAGVPDVGFIPDVGPVPDLGFLDIGFFPPDVGPFPDARVPPDIGVLPPDAGFAPPDVGFLPPDSGVDPDSGVPVDTGVQPLDDAGFVATDAGFAADVGSTAPEDAGVDAGTSPTPVGGEGEESGCTCSAPPRTPPLSALALVGVGLWGVRRRRRNGLRA